MLRFVVMLALMICFALFLFYFIHQSVNRPTDENAAVKPKNETDRNEKDKDT